MFYDILDSKRQNALPKLSFLKDRFYLAGGTGLALQFGHRDSIDFDFFTQEDFNTFDLYKELLEIFGQENITKGLEQKNTLYVVMKNPGLTPRGIRAQSNNFVV
ncbi:MAG: nucleotidyl transferase AbiEii/AbiGii toxin family protein [Candidatus Zambryskibacteria bacterium]|nr:nucleotidyl transferase AbiEii/AbiGii toxin family protein [Candidatus Zambryskibacteria bacterium]